MSHNKQNKFIMSHNQSGMSLISVMISMAVGLMVVMFISQAMVNQVKYSAHIKIKNDRESIRNMIEGKVSCEKTLPVKCSPNSIVNLIDKDGNIFVSKSSPKNYGVHTVRAECNSTGNGLIIRSTRMHTPSLLSVSEVDFMIEPLTKEVIKWGNPKSLLQPEGVSLCSVTPKRKITCLEGSRQGNTLYGSNSVFKFTGTTKNDWGIQCEAPYFRSACSISTPPSHATDRDIVLKQNGCSSDDEEWDILAILNISCCKIDN